MSENLSFPYRLYPAAISLSSGYVSQIIIIMS